MKLFGIVALVALLAPLTAAAQTTDFTVGHHGCGLYVPSVPDCMVSVRSTDGLRGAIRIDYTTSADTSGSYGFLGFLDGYEGLGWASIINILPDGSLQFTGTDSSGVTYYGALSYTFETYHRCAMKHCATYWRITGGTMTVQRVDY